MKLKNFFASILIILACPVAGNAQATVNETTMSMQIRPRAEYRNGVLYPRNESEKPAFFVNNRARLSMEYKRSDLAIKMSAQHVGVWGQDPQIDKNGRFILNEAWALLNFNDGFFAQLGRQALVYDDERLLGGLDWNVAGRFHDALKLGYENSENKLHLILAFNQNDEKRIGGTYYATGGQPYKSMQTLWHNYEKGGSPFKISALFINLGYETGDSENPETAYLQTMGANTSFATKAWKLNLSAYYQTGKNSGNDEVSAYMLSIWAGYNFTPQWSIVLGSDHLSGNDENDSKHKAFDPLYGTHHKFYGSMDYFYASSFLNGLNPGLWDNYLGINHKPTKTINLSLTGHYFSIASDVTVDNSTISKGLGTEIDFQIDWNVKHDVKLSAGYSTMLGTETMDVVKGGDHKVWQDWGWLSLNINPRIFSTKW